MEHITVTDLGNGMTRLVPDAGYKLLDSRNNKKYSEAILKDRDCKYFSAEGGTTE